MVFRYGGEEFAILAPAESQQDIAALLERVREAIAAVDLSNVGSITASFGVVEMRSDTFHITSIENADKALYKSKSDGKNRVTFAEVSGPSSAHIDEDDDDIELF
jgi:diguanylate cyclase (GGDEF)-like protein